MQHLEVIYHFHDTDIIPKYMVYQNKPILQNDESIHFATSQIIFYEGLKCNF